MRQPVQADMGERAAVDIHVGDAEPVERADQQEAQAIPNQAPPVLRLVTKHATFPGEVPTGLIGIPARPADRPKLVESRCDAIEQLAQFLDGDPAFFGQPCQHLEHGLAQFCHLLGCRRYRAR